MLYYVALATLVATLLIAFDLIKHAVTIEQERKLYYLSIPLSVQTKHNEIFGIKLNKRMLLYIKSHKEYCNIPWSTRMLMMDSFSVLGSKFDSHLLYPVDFDFAFAVVLRRK